MGSSAITMSDFAGYTNPDYVGWQRYYVNLDAALDAVNTGRISPAEFENVVNATTGRYVTPKRAANGRVIAYDYADKPTFTTDNPLNSNASSTRRGSVRTPVTTNNVSGAVTSGKITPPSSVPTRAYIANSIASPLVAVGTGIALGKTIDSVLYNANPDFWDANGMSTLNPETWNNITLGIDHTDPVTGVAADLFNVIFGLDPDGTVQAYVDEDVFSYMASYMAGKGVFNTGQSQIDDYKVPGGPTLASPIYALEFSLNQAVTTNQGRTMYTNQNAVVGRGSTGAEYYAASLVAGNKVRLCYYVTGGVATTIMCAYKYEESINYSYQVFFRNNVWYESPQTPKSIGTYDGKRVMYRYEYNTSGADYARGKLAAMGLGQSANQAVNNRAALAWALWYATQHGGSEIEGIGTQDGATVPDPSYMTTPADAKNYLPTVFPGLWDNAVTIPVVQPDGSVDTHTYVPINLPIGDGNGDTQPTSGDETQANPKVDPSTSPAELVDLIQKLLQQPEDDPYSDDLPEDVDPPDTGSGETPIVPAPTGEASALWSIYNPTQAQVDAFGAWLWSPSFVDQIAKIFNNPMESIIGLHKVFAAPHTSGSQNIRVGYLDSGVSSAVVDAQYTTVDCGSVNLAEQFASVFDYAPYTEVKLYLPFVGIVELDPAYVMRSTLKVVYHVDVLTGACLAEVRVTRDGESGGTLYQYAGDAAVQYPISSGSYMGIVAGIAGAVGSIAATVATGGGALPMILGAGGSIAGARTHVQNSGGFGGNAGAMGGKRPYLIIGRPQTKVADRFAALQGYPTNYGVRVGDCDGLIRCAEVRGLVADATDSEMDEIVEAMKEGVIV